ncbi:MAG: hypothetical protein M3Z10_14365 [Gemmatimonadota bacterium]|nr:hypothetical protein [Gemmatimonadota bacterium]
MPITAQLRRIRIAWLFGVVLGCTRSSRDAPSDSVRAAAIPQDESVTVKAAVPAPLPDISAHPIQWDAQKAIEALRALGLAVTAAPTPVREPFLQPSGTRVVVHAGRDSAEVMVFIYGGAIAAGRDIERLDTIAVSPRTVRVSWRAPARIVTNDNLVAIVLSESDSLRARIVDVFHVHAPRAGDGSSHR